MQVKATFSSSLKKSQESSQSSALFTACTIVNGNNGNGNKCKRTQTVNGYMRVSLREQSKSFLKNKECTVVCKRIMIFRYQVYRKWPQGR